MAAAREAESVLMFIGALAADARALSEAKVALGREFGPASVEMPPAPFVFTQYYRRELGPTPLRAFFGYDSPFPPDGLAGLKTATNAIEGELAARIGPPWPRPVNLDPGYLAPDKIVLASAKNFSHRIYLSMGVYAEVTLQYAKGRFVPLPWTFPDYASGIYFGFFSGLRGLLMRNRKGGARNMPETA
jgi:hypothetical protein